MGNFDSRIVGLLAGLACVAATAIVPVANAGDGTIVLQRDVQPRVATRPTMVPDPNPITVNPNISAQIRQQTGELSDSEFASVTSGSSLQQRIVPNGTLVGMDKGSNQSLQSNPLGSNGGAGGGIANSVNRTVQQGLSPLRMLTGDR